MIRHRRIWTERLVVGLVVVLGGGSSGLSGQQLPADRVEQLDSVIAAELALYGAPGMTIAVQQRGTELVRVAHGVANVETGEPMEVGMMGSVASVSKLVTAVTALILANEGLLDLDRPVRSYVPGLPPALGAVTMAQLLSNTAGFAELTPDVLPARDGAILPVCEAMSDRAQVSQPGARWGYSNTGFTLAGCVIEVVGAAPFPEVVQERVFDPIGMTRSTYSPRYAMTYPHAQGHDPRSSPVTVLRPYGSNPRITPAGELITTVEDLTKLAQALMASGQSTDPLPRAPEILEQLSTPRGSGGPFLNGGRQYGFGVFIRQHQGTWVLEHEGIYGGFGASLAMAPEHGISAVAIANGRYSSPVRTTQAGIEAALGSSHAPTQWEYKEVPAAEAAAAVGRFSSASSTIELGLVGGSLRLITPDRSYEVLSHPHGHWEVPGYPAFAPIPVNWLEPLKGGSDQTVSYVRSGWRLYRRVN